MSTKATRLAWEDAFIEQLAKLKVISRAAKAAGTSASNVKARRKRSPEFAKRWDKAMEGDAPVLKNSADSPSKGQWQRDFLAKLAETSNVSASADAANVSTREVYQERRNDSNFARQWRAALFEGYRNLEMEVLGYLREHKPGYKMDVANALRLLAAHKDTAAQVEASRANVSAAEVRASIEKKVETLRKQVQDRQAKTTQKNAPQC